MLKAAEEKRRQQLQQASKPKDDEVRAAKKKTGRKIDLLVSELVVATNLSDGKTCTCEE